MDYIGVMMSVTANSTNNYWESLYSDDVLLPWDIRKPDNALVSKVIDGYSYNIENKFALEVGCGYGHDANYLQYIGYETTAIDVSSTAIDTAERLYPHVNFICKDFLSYKTDQKFDLIYDRGFLHNCAQVEMQKSLDLYSNMLSDDGRIIILSGNYNNQNHEGVVPTPLTINSIEKRCQPNLKIFSVEEIIFEQNEGYPDSLGWVFILKKR